MELSKGKGPKRESKKGTDPDKSDPQILENVRVVRFRNRHPADDDNSDDDHPGNDWNGSVSGNDQWNYSRFALKSYVRLKCEWMF